MQQSPTNRPKDNASQQRITKQRFYPSEKQHGYGGQQSNSPREQQHMPQLNASQDATSIQMTKQQRGRKNQQDDGAVNHGSPVAQNRGKQMSGGVALPEINMKDQPTNFNSLTSPTT